VNRVHRGSLFATVVIALLAALVGAVVLWPAVALLIEASLGGGGGRTPALSQRS